ncbi:aspartate aminotransferase family protein [Alkalihalobacterium elongatum]|uniref:aspartate aminotransferase family protein n=1 Tax=Alkalihalobacterium elongatum TaxID=2675466 RepID=UPI001C1FB801|nr:acetylornithine transaminase [Alkalihalobacterium elongatum]
MTDWQSLDQQYMMSTYNRLPITIEKGEGNHLIDTDGKSYLDLFTGLAVNVLGHSHPEIVKTIKDQGEKFLHISNVFLNQPAIQLAKVLVEQSIAGKVFFTNSGAEATEAAVKLIHKWTKDGEKSNRGVVVLEKSFHGRTLGALKLTRQPGVYQDFPVTDMPVYEVEPHNLDQLEEIIKTKKPAAILMEPVLGSGGILPLEEEYLREVVRLTKKYGVLCCMDEIQTGIGRTGKIFAYQHAGISPDLILFAKGVGGGLPLGGIIVSSELSHLFKPGDHGTTFAPSPLSAALGNTVLKVLLEDGELEKSVARSKYLHDKLNSLKDKNPNVLEKIRGKGMMVGIVTFLAPEDAKRLQRDLLAEGYLVDVTQQTIIRLLPPLTLTETEIDAFIEIFEAKLKLVQQKELNQ